MTQAYIISKVEESEIPQQLHPYMKASKHGPHVTLLYIGEVDEAKKEEIVDAVLMTNFTELKGKFGGIGRFSGSESSQGLDVFYLSVDSAPLFTLRGRLIDALRPVVKPDQSHGFVPHMTVCFIKETDPMPFHRVQTVPVNLGRIRVVVGKEYVDLPTTAEAWQSFPYPSKWSTF